jgi:hypothetical protein
MLQSGSAILWANAQQLELTLPEMAASETGGAAIIGYDMQIDDGLNGEYRYVIGGNRSANTLQTSVFLTAEDGLQSGLTYRVRFRAINEIGEGPWSDIAFVRAVVLPSAPPSPVVTAFDATQIDLTLPRAPDDGDSAGGTAMRYNLHANEGEDGSAFHNITAYDGTALTYSIAAGAAIGASGGTFTVGKVYQFKLTAENEVGDSELRYPAPVTRIALGRAPLQPTQPTIDFTYSTDTYNNMSWPMPTPTDSLPLIRYLIYSDLGIPGNSDLVYNSTDMNVLTFLHHDLLPGILYSYWLQVENFNGLSPNLTQDATAHASRYACAVPRLFTSLEIVAKSATVISLTWSEPLVFTGCEILSYQVYADDGSAGTLTAVGTALPGTQHAFDVASPTVHTLVLGAEHRLAVVATTHVGSVQSNVVSAIVADLPAMPAAGPVVVKAETDVTKIRASFSEFSSSASDTGGSLILSYQLQRTAAVTAIQAAQVAVDWYDIGGAAGNYSLDTDYTIEGLQKGGNYGFRYRAINVNGPGPWSEITVITAATIPSAPPAPQYLSSTGTQIVLGLSRSADDGGTAIYDYELEIDQGNSADVRISSSASSFTKIVQYSYTVDGLQFTVDVGTLGLTAGRLYRFRWRSLNFMGYSPWSDTARIGLGALPSAPGTPTRLANSADGVYIYNTRTSIGLQWAAVTGDALPVYEYRVYVDDGNLINRTEAYRGPLTYTTVDELIAGVEYTFTVTAISYNGEGANSSTVALRSCVPPSGVATPTLFYSTETSVTLRWGQPDDDGGCEVSAYQMYRDDGAGGAITTPVSFDDATDFVAEPYKFEHVVVLGASFAGKTVRF